MPPPAPELAAASALAYELAAGLPEPCRADFLRLTRSLLYGPRFQWLLAEAHSDVLRDRLLLALDRVLSRAGLHSSHLPIDRTIADVPALEAALARHAKGCAVVHVLAQRSWFDAARWDAFNVRREQLVSSAPARLLFWLDAEAIEAAANGAPDLWAWRAGVYSFREELAPQQPSGVVVPHTLQTTSEPPDVRTVEERCQRVLELRQLLGNAASLTENEQVSPVDELGRLLYSLGDYDEALQHWVNVELPLHIRRGDEWAQAVTRGQIADILQARGQLDEALRIRQEEQLPVYERLGDVRSAAITRGKIADILHARGQLGEALRIRQEHELPVFERLGDVRSAAVTRWKIALQRFDMGEHAAAAELFRNALAVFERMGLPEAEQVRQMMQERGLSPEPPQPHST
jgi:tetratricopeptide (TPR) repeat protein